jgi:hypothetical protein
MAKQIYRFSGKAAYVTRNAKVFPNSSDPVWTMALYPITAADRKAIRDTGIKNHTKEDDGVKSGVEGLFFTFRSPEQYAILDASGMPIAEDILVGNGSDVTIELEVETFNSPRHGPQARSKLRTVTVDNLIVYVPKPKEASVSDAPADLPA